ncbi:MAG: hypothetical protein QM504_14910 [Pseudomonadota bacterium]
MQKLSENLLTIASLSEEDKTFLYKRLFFSQITAIAAWGIIISAATAWLLLYWLKPSLVSSAHLLQLLKDKTIDYLQLAELAVTGASAVTALFVLLVFIALMMLSFAKKEMQYLKIINALKDLK